MSPQPDSSREAGGTIYHTQCLELIKLRAEDVLVAGVIMLSACHSRDGYISGTSVV